MIAALRAVRARKPKKLICAAAVASPHALRDMSREADAVVCLSAPPHLFAVGQFFEDFAQVTDEDVVAILERHRATAQAAAANLC